MKIRSLLLSLVLLGTVATTSAQDIVVVDGVKYTIHDVSKGETLYSLSRRYGVTIEAITSANAILSEGLKVGQRIKIPVNDAATKKTKKSAERATERVVEPKVEKTTEPTTEPIVEQVAEAPSQPATTASGILHTVAKRETLYSLSKKYGVTIDEICAANPSASKGLKVGDVVVIPTKPSASAPTAQVAMPETEAPQQTEQQSEPYRISVSYGEIAQSYGEEERLQSVFNQILSDLRWRSNQPFRTLAPGSRAEVALLLPLGTEEKPSQNYLDFYRGFLIGLDSVRMSGHSVNLNLFNTAHSHERIETLIESSALYRADLVVGPIYEDEMLPVASALQQRGTPIVSPLANLTHATTNSVFQMSPSPAAKFDKVRALFNGSKRVVFISTDSNDGEFEAEVRSMLSSEATVVHHKYIYEHPSVIAKRARERELNGTHSPSDMTPLLHGKEPTVIVITANNEVDVDRILAALASAKSSLRARSQRVVPYVVFGNNRWNRYRNIDKSLFFTNNVTMLSTYHARRSDDKVRAFDRRFVKEFNALPSLYAYRGYDAAVLFVSALYGGLETGLEGVLSMPLLTPYVFEVDAATGVRKNNQWVKINYNSDSTITTE